MAADPYDILAKRATGELPLSIGTSMAIEALKEPAVYEKYDTLWINIRTLWRNIYDAIEREDRERMIKPPSPAQMDAHYRQICKAMADTMKEELQQIRGFLDGKLKGVRVYHLGYKDLAKKYPMAILRVPTTPLQQQYADLMERTLDYVLMEDADTLIEQDKGSELRGEQTKSLIITHCPVDLLSRTKFNQLRLLESHTGAIKSKSQWSTKLTEGKEMKIVPFNYFTIQVFGDGGVHFNRWAIKARRELLEVATSAKWTPVTTMEKIKYNLKGMKDQFLAKQLQRLL
ncbi:hypothetical protein CF95_gp016 [Erwinia phage PhiEaH1]|jgi:hypothetical protein|uniref:Uncharacterized protein n=1 Tax=Erwinia phage PhiEaH1 TaxID=1401669 RepID=W8D0E7_9CAUD|nr:hypothetical protein CF95_gp016 [Erwinia phage PhiEaH1]AGX01738.1 hypothetical protein [Erwinia phage PhiEaH1]WBF04830.1 hypothetical protein [Erwinia phage vB_Ea277G]